MTNVTTLPLSTKICSRCKQELPVSRFDQDLSVRSTGLRSQCKTCRSELRKTYKTKPRVRKSAKAVAKPAAKSTETPVEQKPKAPPRPRYTPQQILKQKANREAILRLINNHRAEFNSLVYSEQVRLGIVSPGERRDVGEEMPSWVSLA